MDQPSQGSQIPGEEPGRKSNAMVELDLLLPKANVARVMKMSIPESAKISRQAKDCMQDCVTEFLAFVTSEAAELCSGEKRKTINGKDVLHALMSLGMENYAAVLAIYLARYRQYVSKGGEIEDDNEDEDQNSSNSSSA